MILELSRFNHLAPSVDYVIHLTKILIFICGGNIEEISYEWRVYESGDDRSLSWLYFISLRKGEVRGQRVMVSLEII